MYHLALEWSVSGVLRTVWPLALRRYDGSSCVFMNNKLARCELNFKVSGRAHSRMTSVLPGQLSRLVSKSATQPKAKANPKHHMNPTASRIHCASVTEKAREQRLARNSSQEAATHIRGGWGVGNRPLLTSPYSWFWKRGSAFMLFSVCTALHNA